MYVRTTISPFSNRYILPIATHSQLWLARCLLLLVPIQLYKAIFSFSTWSGNLCHNSTSDSCCSCCGSSCCCCSCCSCCCCCGLARKGDCSSSSPLLLAHHVLFVVAVADDGVEPGSGLADAWDWLAPVADEEAPAARVPGVGVSAEVGGAEGQVTLLNYIVWKKLVQ